jgi:hypothetical protein
VQTDGGRPDRGQLLTSWLVLVLMALTVIVGLVLLALGGAGT